MEFWNVDRTPMKTYKLDIERLLDAKYRCMWRFSNRIVCFFGGEGADRMLIHTTPKSILHIHMHTRKTTHK